MTQSSCQEDCNVDIQDFECNLDSSYFPSTCDNFSRHISDTANNRLNCNARNNIDPTIDSNDPVTINQSQHPAADLLNRNDSNVINDIFFPGLPKTVQRLPVRIYFELIAQKLIGITFHRFFLPVFVASFQKLMTLQL